MKNFLKQTLIIILMCITILLIFSVLFYDYIPNNKVVPSKAKEYQTSNKILEEINEEVLDMQRQNLTFEITDSELKIRKQDHTYDSGKANPFATPSKDSPGSGNNNEMFDKDKIEGNKNSESSEHFFEDNGGIK